MMFRILHVAMDEFNDGFILPASFNTLPRRTLNDALQVAVCHRTAVALPLQWQTATGSGSLSGPQWPVPVIPFAYGYYLFPI